MSLLLAWQEKNIPFPGCVILQLALSAAFVAFASCRFALVRTLQFYSGYPKNDKPLTLCASAHLKGKTMPHISIKEAAKLAGVHRTTITRALESGKLSAVTLDNGQRCIDPSELNRAFPSDRPVLCAPTPMKHDAPTAHAMVLEARLEELLHLVRTLEEDKRDLRRRLDNAEQERRSMIMFIEDKRQPKPWWQLWKRAA